MQVELDALRCAGAAFEARMNACGRSEEDFTFVAAYGVFRRAWRELNDVHKDLATWHMETRS